MSDPVTKVN